MYLYGASGHCKVIIDIINESKECAIEGIVDDSPKLDSIFNIPVLNADEIDSYEGKQLIVSIGDNSTRKRIVEKINAIYTTAIHPTATISAYAKIEAGTVIMAGAILNPDVMIGKHCIINTGAIIEHDCVLEDFVHVAPRASLAGSVAIGEGTHIGIGASIIQGLTIGKWVTIGAGAVIVRDVPDFAVVVGSPGRILKYNSQENE
jgi:acetyltransferase EpsM